MAVHISMGTRWNSFTSLLSFRRDTTRWIVGRRTCL